MKIETLRLNGQAKLSIAAEHLDSFPTMGQMLNDHLGDHSQPESRAAMIERYKDSM